MNTTKTTQATAATKAEARAFVKILLSEISVENKKYSSFRLMSARSRRESKQKLNKKCCQLQLSMIISYSRRLLALIKWNDEYFLFSTEISDNKLFMRIWNMQVFDKDDEADIICKMKLENVMSDGKTRRKEYSNCFMAFIGTCLPYKCSARDVIAEEDCFGMPLDWFKNHYLKAAEKDTATYSVTIYLRKTNKVSGSVSSDTNKDV